MIECRPNYRLQLLVRQREESLDGELGMEREGWVSVCVLGGGGAESRWGLSL